MSRIRRVVYDLIYVERQGRVKGDLLPDVDSFIFKWHPVFAPRYVNMIRGMELIVSFMTLAEMRQGALDAKQGKLIVLL